MVRARWPELAAALAASRAPGAVRATRSNATTLLDRAAHEASIREREAEGDPPIHHEIEGAAEERREESPREFRRERAKAEEEQRPE